MPWYPLTQLADCTLTRTPPIGVLGDGQGVSATLELDPAGLDNLDLAAVKAAAQRDPARPSGVQLLTELPGALSTSDQRAFLAVRHEPLWAPGAVAERGGGLPGARRAVAAAASRLRQTLAHQGIRARFLDRHRLRALLAPLDDPAECHADAVVTGTATHCALTIAASDWHRLRSLAATIRVRHVVLSRWTDTTDGRTGAAIRVVAADPAAAAAAHSGLLGTGMARPRTGDQPAAIAETLPFGGAPRPLVSALRATS